ncbi:hypothetical protein ACOKFD_06880 [Flagellimonas sp. S174]|uniref:hypothetical protein n=1 Tax=Flagellimonas sp. S174 TaxID=3410790 RepID=UPI003BF509DF
MLDNDQLIAKFLTKTLSKEEQLHFDTLLSEDPSFRDEVALLQDLQKVAEAEDDTMAKEMVGAFEAEHRNKKAGSPLKIWWVAASLALLFSIGYFAAQQGPPDTQTLFAENFEPYRNVVHPITRATQQEELTSRAFTHYEKGEYSEALELFQKLYETTNTPHYLFYQANALLQLNRPKEAIVALEAHLKTKDTLTQKSHWYLAMAYLKLDDVVNAKKNLEKVLLDNTYNVKKAKNLLRTLD